MKRIVLSILMLFFLLVGCKRDVIVKQNLENKDLVLDAVSFKNADDQVVDENTPWDNLYLSNEGVLKDAVSKLKISKKEAIDLMDKSAKLRVIDTAFDTIISVFKTSEMGYYASAEYSDKVIANNGLGVGYLIYNSPNGENDGADTEGNYYSFSIYENYEDRILQQQHIILDLNTFCFYKMNLIEGDYESFDYPKKQKKRLQSILDN